VGGVTMSVLPKLQYNYLGRTGLKVSELCFGAMTFGENQMMLPSEHDQQVCFDLLDTFVKAGGNFIDTADAYGKGNSEKVLGNYLHSSTAPPREDLVIATKFFSQMGTSPNSAGASRKHIIDAVECSLSRLQTNYIDLYQIHCWDSATPFKETLTTLNDLVRSGKVRYIGASNFTGWQLQKAICTSQALGLEVFSSLQPQYSLLCRSTEWELFPVCREEGLGVLPWSPLKGGWLSGKYRRGMTKPETGSRLEWAQNVGWTETNWQNFANEHTWGLIDSLDEISKETNKTVAQVSLKWAMQRPGVSSTIIGARTKQQLEDNLGASGWQLSEQQMDVLNTKSQVPLPYPYGMIKSINTRVGRRREKHWE